MKLSLPITIALHVALIACLFPWLSKQHWQLQNTTPVVQAYIAAPPKITEISPAKLGTQLVKTDQKRPHHKTASSTQTHWPKLSNNEVKQLLMQLSAQIDTALQRINWPKDLTVKVTVAFELKPNNHLSDIHFFGSHLSLKTAQKIKQLLLNLPAIKNPTKHGPLPIALPIRIGHNAQPFNPLGSL